jgi:hypothetical protein
VDYNVNLAFVKVFAHKAFQNDIELEKREKYHKKCIFSPKDAEYSINGIITFSACLGV